MARYRKRQIEVEANQYLGEPVPGLRMRGEGLPPVVVTIQAQVIPVTIGEWVILEVRPGRAYPCSDEEFQRIYEPA